MTIVHIILNEKISNTVYVGKNHLLTEQEPQHQRKKERKKSINTNEQERERERERERNQQATRE